MAYKCSACGSPDGRSRIDYSTGHHYPPLCSRCSRRENIAGAGIIVLMLIPPAIAYSLGQMNDDGDPANALTKFAVMGGFAMSAWIAYAFGLFGNKQR